MGRAATDGDLLSALPSEQHTDLSFLEFRAEPPPIVAHETPLKKLEFKDLAPPARPESPAFVRRSPKKALRDPEEDDGAAAAEVGAARDGQEQEAGDGGEGDDEVREDIEEAVGEESVGGGDGEAGMESKDAESPAGGQGESFHESYDGGLEDARAGDDETDPVLGEGEDGLRAARNEGEGEGAGEGEGDGAGEGAAGAGDGAAEPEVEGVEEAAGAEGGEPEVAPEARGDSKEGGERDEEDDEEEEEGGGDGEEVPLQNEQERAQLDALEADVRQVILNPNP